MNYKNTGMKITVHYDPKYVHTAMQVGHQLTQQSVMWPDNIIYS